MSMAFNGPARKLAAAALLAAMCVTVSACGRLQAHRGYIIDEAMVSAVQPGIDNKQSVEGTLGRPTFVGQFDQNDWYYVSRDTRQLAFTSPRTTEQTILHVRFDSSGRVASVERTGLEQIASINPEGDKTPTRGRERGFFEDIFGNVGAVGATGSSGQSNDPTVP